MQKFYSPIAPILIFCFINLFLWPSQIFAQQEEEEEYWTLVPGVLGDQLIPLDSSIVFVSQDYGLINENQVMRNTINLYHFNMAGELTNTYSFNIFKTEWLENVEVLRSLGRHKVHRLSNGNFLMGGHGEVVSKDQKTLTAKIHPNYLNHKPFLEKQYDKGIHKEKETPTHPLILTFNPTLDSLLRIDTLPPVPSFGAVTLIHEVAPDTLIIGFHKTNESRQQIMETDSLFNIRWSTEFGQQGGWIADIYDFQVTSEGDYLVSMNYYDPWSPSNALGVYKDKNILFKFDKVNGELLWQEQIWIGKGFNKIASMAPWQNDKVVIALDDCCKPNSHNSDVYFHEHTGMHLQIRDSDGDIHEEINLAGFLTAFIKIFPGPSAYGDDLEDPDNKAPWFIPYRIIRNPDNSYLVTGIQYSSNPRGFGRGFLVKLDDELQPLWARIFEIDKKNYIYGGDENWLFNVVTTGDKIFLGGSFTTAGFWSTPSPYYPPNYPWNSIFRMDLFIPLDEHGCYEPGCHLTDNVPYYELEQAITLSPNPARDRVTIRVDHNALSHKKKVLYISDMQGNAMLTQEFTDNHIDVSLSGYSPGTYLVYIMSEGQVFRGEKLLVK